MLDTDASRTTVSTGLPALDAVLDGLYWGDNVVWDLDGAFARPFYAAIAGLDDAFDSRWVVSVGGEDEEIALEGVEVIRAGPGTALAQPAELLREIQRRCQAPKRRLLLFESLDRMIAAWGAHNTRGLFSRCCPLLLEVGAVAYWAMSVRGTPATVRDTVRAVTQCVLRIDERSVRVVKAEGRREGATGSVLHWHRDNGLPVLEPANVNGRVAASLRALRRSRELSQHDLAELAGVTASAISQAERAERGLSLATLVKLSAALDLTIDDLLRGEETDLYRIGRRVEDPERGLDHPITLLASTDSELKIDLVQLGARQAGTPPEGPSGTGIVAVASGLVQVQIARLTPAVRRGEVLVADAQRIDGWRNLGLSDALLFWIVVPPAS